MPEKFWERVADYQRRVDMCLGEALPPATLEPKRLHEAMRYAVFNGGKRVRPLLTYAAGECLDVDARLLDAPLVICDAFPEFLGQGLRS